MRLILHQKLSSKQSLIKHIEVIHEGIKAFKCDLCDSDFSRDQNLQTHIASVHDQIKHYCPTCNTGFMQVRYLQRHIKTVHDKVKPFVCDICNFSFGHKSDLKRHTKNIHEKRKESILPTMLENKEGSLR